MRDWSSPAEGGSSEGAASGMDVSWAKGSIEVVIHFAEREEKDAPLSLSTRSTYERASDTD